MSSMEEYILNYMMFINNILLHYYCKKEEKTLGL